VGWGRLCPSPSRRVAARRDAGDSHATTRPHTFRGVSEALERPDDPPDEPPEARLRESADAADLAFRELIAVREIARAFLAARRPDEVFQFALERVSPVLGATFASLYLLEPGSELMRHAAAYNWPQRHAQWAGEMRVRLGYGPSGQAAKERRPVEVPDVLADPALADWREVAEELGFRAIAALPLETSRRALGAVTFYFADAGAFDSGQRALLRTVADQLAATAEKAAMIEELRKANTALVRANAELERQYAALEEARRVKDEFLSNISHELRTPLTAVIGYIGVMQEEIPGPLTPAQRDDLTQVRSASNRLLGLIDDLLELTTLKRGEFDVVAEEFDPREPVHEAMASTPGRPAGVTVDVDVTTGELPHVRSDRRKIVRILVSLLSNAYKFTPAGHVRLSVAVADERVAWRVEDTGIGIAPEALLTVFDEFRQADGSLTRRYGGTGLGLALARRLAQLLGGDITVESAAEGAGTTFTLDLPLQVQTALAGPRDASTD
jgi:signal transduction histidine kinase